MRNGFIFFKYNLKAMVYQKSFWFTNLFFVLMMVALVAFVAFTGDDKPEKVKIFNESSLPITNEVFKEIKDFDIEVIPSDATNYKEKLKSEDWSAYITISKDVPPSVVIYGNDTNAQLEATISGIVSEFQKQVSISKLQISEEEKVALLTPVQVESKSIEKNNEKEEFNFDKYILFYALIMLFYFLSISYPQSILNMLVSAKESRAVESLLVRVTPSQFFYGKIITSVVIAVLQLCLFLLLFLVPFALREKQATFDMLATAIENGLTIPLIGIYILCFFLTITFYSVLNGILSAFVNRLEEVTSVAYYATIGTLAGFMVSFMLFMSGDPGTLHYSLAILPFTAPFLLFTLYMTGDLTATLFVISLAVQIVTLVIMFRFAGSIYKKYLFNSNVTVKGLFSRKKIKTK